jgi:hypothetical protein
VGDTMDGNVDDIEFIVDDNDGLDARTLRLLIGAFIVVDVVVFINGVVVVFALLILFIVAFPLGTVKRDLRDDTSDIMD